MSVLDQFLQSLSSGTFQNYRIPQIGVLDVIEILLIAFVIYHIMVWIQSTKTWNLLRGFLILIIIYLVAYLLQMTTIVWVISRTLNIGVIALVILFQPELRRALEQLGNRNILSAFFNPDMRNITPEFDENVIEELVTASVEMSRVRTGALIVIQRNTSLEEYRKTGIAVDGIVTSQLLINIFEKNTPLHDGAVIVRGNRIVSATCYLPLSENMAISKALGTRHRAGVGISEVTDSLTIIVSEETGKISLAFEGDLTKSLTADGLRAQIRRIMFAGEGAERKDKRGNRRS